MYSGYYTATLGLRAKSSVSYSHLSLWLDTPSSSSSSSCCHCCCCASELVPRGVQLSPSSIYGRILRQSARRRIAAASHRPSLYRDGSFIEVLGLLAGFQGSYSESLCYRRQDDDLDCKKMGSWEMGSIPEGRFRRLPDRCGSGRNGSVSSSYSLRSSSFLGGFGVEKTKQRRFNGEELGRNEVKRNGSSSTCYSGSSSGNSGAFGAKEDKMRRGSCQEGGKDEARGNRSSSVCYSTSFRNFGGREAGRRTGEELNKGFIESGREKIGEKVNLKEVREVREIEEDDLGALSSRKASQRKVRERDDEELFTRSGYDREQCVGENYQSIDELRESKEGSRKGVRFTKLGDYDGRKVSELDYEVRDENIREDTARSQLRGFQKGGRISEVRKDDTTRASTSRMASELADRKTDEHIARGSREGSRKGVRVTELNEDDTKWELASRTKVSQSAHESTDEYVKEEQHFVAERDSREGSSTMYKGHEDDRRRASSYRLVDARNSDFDTSSSSAVRRHSNSNQQVIGFAESRRSSENITDLTEIHDSSLERSSQFRSRLEETSVENREDRSTSLQYSVQVARDKKTDISQDMVDQTDLRNHLEDHGNVSNVSNSQQHLEDSIMKDRKERSTSVRTIVQVARDKSTQTDEQIKLTEQSSNRTNISSSSHSRKHFEEAVLIDRENKSSSVQNLVQLARDQQAVDQASTNKQYENRLNVSKVHVGTSEDGRSSRRVSGSRMDDRDEFCTSAHQIHGSGEQQKRASEQVTREQILRLESRQKDKASEVRKWNIEGGSSSIEEHTSRIESQKEGSSVMLVRDKVKQSTKIGESSSSTEAHTAFSRSSDGGSSSIYTHALDLDDQSSRDEMYQARDDALGSLRRQDQSSAVYVGEFVDKLQQEISASDKSQMEEIYGGATQAAAVAQVSDIDVTASQENKKNIQEDPRQSSSRSAPKGPSDEMWDVRGQSSQEPSRIEEPEEYSSPVGVEDSTATSVTETSISRRSNRSMWAYIAEIIRKGWGSQAGPKNLTLKSGTRSSSNESIGSEAWFSGHEPDENDEETDRKGKDANGKELAPVKRPSDTSPIAHPISSLEITEEPRLGDGMPLLGSGLPVSAGRENVSVLGGVSVVSKLEPEGLVEAEKVRQGIPSSAGTVGNTVVSRNDKSSSSIQEEISEVGNLQLPRSEVPEVEEEVVIGEIPEVSGTTAKDTELKRRKLQRNKQVLKETFDEWEEAYKLEAEQRKLDEHFMREALLEAKKAAGLWEVPVGAVLVQNGEVIARGYNLVEELRDSTAHAEMICIREASNLLRTWRLAGTTLYVTLEPCAMCAGAILQARIDTVVWGAPNKLLGADGSWVRLFPGDTASNSLDQSDRTTTGPVHPFHPKITIRRGILAADCSDAMQQFFKLRRKKEKKSEAPPPTCLPITNYGTKLVTKMHNIFCVMFCL